LTLFIYPLTIGGMTLWRFWGSSSDRTSDAFIADVFASSAPNAVLLLSRDTALFGGQYARYARNLRPDIAVIHPSRLQFADYHETLQKVHPDIRLPSLDNANFLTEFVMQNAAVRPVMANHIIPTPPEWVWVPHGLLFQLMPKSEVPPATDMIEKNAQLWDSFSDPTRGLLSRYNHLMLSNIRDEYASLSIEYGKILINAQELKEAKKQFERAITYESDTQQEQAFMYLGLSQLFLNECSQALDSFSRAHNSGMAPNAQIYQYEAITYRDCLHDDVRAKESFGVYEEMMRQKEQPLQEL
jgi:tetratricopeptide (TPR) repeat protein